MVSLSRLNRGISRGANWVRANFEKPQARFPFYYVYGLERMCALAGINDFDGHDWYSEHAIDVLADIEMRTLYFDVAWLKRERHGASLASKFVVRVSPLLHQAILALFDDGKSRERMALLIKLVMLELDRAEDSATFVPLPQEARCRRAADIVLRAPAVAHEIETLAQKVGTSARTLSRLFSAETQLSFKSWCQRARIASAIERLSTQPNASVKQIAADLGYASIPAFSHAFRQVTGKTPTEFVEARPTA